MSRGVTRAAHQTVDRLMDLIADFEDYDNPAAARQVLENVRPTPDSDRFLVDRDGKTYRITVEEFRS